MQIFLKLFCWHSKQKLFFTVFAPSRVLTLGHSSGTWDERDAPTTTRFVTTTRLANMFSGTGAEVCAQARAEGLDVLEPTMDTFLRHLQEACAEFDPASHPSTPHDKHGWMDPYIMRVFNKLHASAPLLLVEVGSWKGQSAIAFAKRLQQLGPAHRLLCVDVRRSQP